MSYSSQSRQVSWRHNSILSSILAQFHDIISKSASTGIKIYADLSGWTIGGGTIPPNILTTSQRPDPVIVDETKNGFFFMELTIPFKMNIKDAHNRKLERNGSLVADLRSVGYKVELSCVEIGPRGLITNGNKTRIKTIFKFVGSKARKSFFRDVAKNVLLCSYALWNCRHAPLWIECP